MEPKSSGRYVGRSYLWISLLSASLSPHKASRWHCGGWHGGHHGVEHGGRHGGRYCRHRQQGGRYHHHKFALADYPAMSFGSFLLDPGVSGVRSMVPGASKYLQHLWLRLCWCDSGWCYEKLSAQPERKSDRLTKLSIWISQRIMGNCFLRMNKGGEKVMEDNWRLSFTKLWNNPPATTNQKIQKTTGLPLSDKSYIIL